MPKVKAKQKVEPEIYGERTQVSSVIFGLVMVVAIIVAGAAMLGGSLSQAGKRWASAMDGASRAAGLSVQTVEVIGLEHVPPVARQVIDAAMIAPGENMFRADPYVIRERVEATRLVTNVRVYRLWPDTVMIRADAARADALWHDGEHWTVVDTLGRIMPGKKPENHPGLIQATGAGAPTALPKLNQALRNLPDLQARIVLARRVAARRWDLELVNGTVIRLPADEGLNAGVTRLAELEAQSGLSERPLDLIDLRVAGRVFLTPSEPQPDENGAA